MAKPHQLSLSEFKAAINTVFDENSELRKILLTLDLGIPDEHSPIDKPVIWCIIKILKVAYQNTKFGSDEEKRVIRMIGFLEEYT